MIHDTLCFTLSISESFISGSEITCKFDHSMRSSVYKCVVIVDIQVLFWGVRELKRIQFQTVDKPRIDIECAGHVLSSSIIQNTKKNPNFSVPVKFFDVVCD